MRHLETAVDVVTALGGIKNVAALTGRKYNAAANWPAFGRFPPNTYLLMQKALEDCGCSADAELWNMPAPVPDVSDETESAGATS